LKRTIYLQSSHKIERLSIRKVKNIKKTKRIKRVRNQKNKVNILKKNKVEAKVLHLALQVVHHQVQVQIHREIEVDKKENQKDK